MKRLTFIRNIGLVGAAATLAPTTLFSSNSDRSIHLGKGSLHVPHGNFFQSLDSWVSVEEMNIECSVDRFMRNGMENHAQDLMVYKFRRGGEVLIVSKGKDGFNFVGSISGLEESGSSLFSETHVLDLNSRNGFLRLSRKV